ncbi:MAG: hypothetical protein COB61_005190 [Thiotrichales bacterium]|nr:hypothetical protein [Thiotrichales bacterium]
MQQVVEFFNHPFFMVVGGILSLLAVLGIFSTMYLVLKGVVPVWYKLGISLSKRKIAIFSDEKFNELKDVLIDSGMFHTKNILKIDKASIKKAAETSFYIIHYLPYKDCIDEIISMKKDSDAMVVYAPQDEGFIEKDILNKLNSQRNTIIVNFRGRLLNDVLVSMITTSFKK